MYKLYIVDDESSVRAGLRDCVDWASFGLEVAGDAEDGNWLCGRSGRIGTSASC